MKEKKRSIPAAHCVRLLMLCLPLLLVSYPLFAQTSSGTIQEADQVYNNRKQPQELERAIAMYQALLNGPAPAYEAAWKLSRAFWYKGQHAPEGEKNAAFQKGIDAARQASVMEPDQCEGHFWLGVNIALLAEQSGMLKALGMVDDAKEAIHRALEIKENCECGGPHRVLGKMYSRLPFFKGGSTKKAVEHLNRSLELCPNDTQSRIFLAEIYIDENKKGFAIQQLKNLLKQEPDPQWIPETKENKIIAEKMLKQLESK